jgi:putative PIN family toxin of toxin-antitoxin system
LIRVVADTNVYISALLFGGLPGEFLDLAFLPSFQLITSPVLLDELDDKLRLKFRLSDERRNFIRMILEKHAEIVRPGIVLAAVRDDPDDDRVLECAVAGEAEFLVSGDKHLLRLGAHEGIKIVTVRQFLDDLPTDF